MHQCSFQAFARHPQTIPTSQKAIAVLKWQTLRTKFLSLSINFDSISLVSIPIYRVSVSLAIRLLMFIIYLLVKYFKIQISVLETMSKKVKYIFFTGGEPLLYTNLKELVNFTYKECNID